MRRRVKKGVAIMLSLTLAVGYPNVFSNGTNNVKADENIGSISDKISGTWSYEANGQEIVKTNEMLTKYLPTIANKGITRFTTDNYDKNNAALDIGGWSTSMLWSYLNPSENGRGNVFGNSTYAIPLSYKATSTGMYVTKPSTIRVETTLLMNQPEDGSLTDFVIGSGNADKSEVDKETEWSTDVMLGSMKMTMVQGSPFAFIQTENKSNVTLTRKRVSLPSGVSYFDGSDLSSSTMVVLRVFDNQDDATGYSNYDYYALYLPKGAKLSQSGTDNVNGIGQLNVEFPSTDKSYCSFAWLCESKGQNDGEAEKIAKLYEKYAYNFVTDTETSYSYNDKTSTLTTNYKYTLDKKEESTADGTVMGILPHQYKNMTGYTYLDNEARTIRGNMKYLVGDSYSTNLKYSGILPSMPSIYTSDHDELAGYVKDFMEEYGPTDTKVTKEEYGENTYDTGKKMNRAIQVMEAAEECGDTDSANKLLKGLEAELSDWFTYSGEDDTKYFYYDSDVGSLLGFPQAYYTVDGLTDHHFHYGYFIQAAAQVTLRDPDFAKKYGNVIDELIGDIATETKNSPTARYPFLRQFSTWEGHSWASGHANFADGNNQESSSEAINAWAALILYGEATHNDKLTKEGIYLYQTEISAVNSYWFDIDGDVLDDAYKQTSAGDSSLPKYIQASMVWGGKYTYAAWWTAEPLQIQGINILPMTSASFYYAANTDYIKNNWKTANINESSFVGDDKNTKRWNEIWSEYLAIADPSAAMDYFDVDCDPEAGESKAHAFHYINALDKAGTPDLSITSDNPLSCAFKNSDGEITYVTYNADDTTKTVTFSDGTTVEAPPKKMTTVSDSAGEVSGKATYTIEHYLQKADGTYTLFNAEKKSAKIGKEVTAVEQKYSGYTLDKNAEGTVLSGVVDKDGGLVLRLYYNISQERPTMPAEDENKYTKIGTSNGIDIYYYVLRNDFGAAIKLLDAGKTFYVEYSGEYNSGNTKAWVNKTERNDYVLTGVCKFDPSTLTENTYNTVKLSSGDKGVYIVIKYGSPTTAPDLSDYDGEIETADPNIPSDIAGFVVGTTGNNNVNISFRDTEEQQAKGQTYNVYINGTKVLENIKAGSYTIDKVTAGKVTVKITAVLNNTESAGISKTIKVSGESYEKTTEPVTDKPTEKSTEPVTDMPIIEPTSGDVAKPTTKASNDTKKSVKNTKVTLAKRVTKKKVKISLKKVKAATGYQVKYSSTKKFKKGTVKTKYVKKTRFVLKVFKPNKKYYVKARAYKSIKGIKYFGKWSKVKTVKVKK